MSERISRHRASDRVPKPHSYVENAKYRGAAKSLALSGSKQARKQVRDARDFNNIETQAVIKFCFFPPLQGKAPEEIHAILTDTLACFLPGRAKDLSAPLYTGCLIGLPKEDSYTQNTPTSPNLHIPPSHSKLITSVDFPVPKHKLSRLSISPETRFPDEAGIVLLVITIVTQVLKLHVAMEAQLRAFSNRGRKSHGPV